MSADLERHQECPNCDDSNLDVQILDERRDEHLQLHTKQCRWLCLNCGWTSQIWWVMD